MNAAASRAAALRPKMGGKAAALSIAAEEGLLVPPLHALSVDDVAALAAGNGDARTALTQLELAVRALGDGPFAVRSSAQAEDGERSFAGQFESILRVPAADVPAAVVEVAESGSAERVERYAGATGVGAGRVAVLVQHMVEGSHAGVAFSRDPLTFQPEIVVEAVAGLGDSLVGGQRTPTQARFDRDRVELADLVERDSVPAAALEQAARLALRCEGLFGEPQDIEWVFDGDRVWLLQARRLTGFDNPEVFSDTWSSEVWPGLIKPLVFDVGDTAVNAAWGRILTSLAGPTDVDWRRMAGLAASRVYFNESLLGTVLARAGLPENTLESLGRGEKPRLREGSWWRLVLSAGRLVRFLWRDARWLSHVRRELPPLRARAAEQTLGLPDAAGPEIAARIPGLVGMLEDISYLSALTTLSLQARGLYARLALKLFSAAPDQPLTAIAESGTAPLLALARASEKIAALSAEDRAVAATGDLAAIEARLRESDQGKEALAAMAEVVEDWGHVATVNTDFSTPCWRDEPGMLWRLASASRAADAVGRAVSSIDPVATARGPVGRAVIRRRLAVLRRFVDGRDEVNDLLARVYDAWRTAARAAGARLTPEVLDDAHLVYYLDLAELGSALNGNPAPSLGPLASERAARLATDAELSPPHRLWDLRLPARSRMSAVARSETRHGCVLRGVAASPGVVEGRAHVLGYSAATDGLGPEDILVVGHADVGLTPLFSIVGGVVTGAGGALSHAAVVARELGIPAVVGVDDAMDLVPHGARIRIDGSDGTVTVVGCELDGSLQRHAKE